MDLIPKKKLGFGLMRLPTLDKANAAHVDLEQVCEMVDLFLSSGFTYFDTAWMYQAFASESVAKKVLTERHPRGSFTLATKLHSSFFDTLKGRDDILSKQLENTGAGYFDYYLLHGIEASMLEKHERLDCFQWLLEKKDRGLMRHVGFSFHGSAELLDRILTRHPEMEFVQLQINYLDWDSPWIQSRACYEVCLKHKKPVIVMEPVKGGTLATIPSAAAYLFKTAAPNMSVASWGIRFAASLPGVIAVLSGMSNLEQVRDNIRYMSDFQPLSDKERELCFQAAEIINSQTAVPCTACSYCTEGCPMHIAIPQYFSLYNEDMRENLEEKGWTASFGNYEELTTRSGRPGDCIGCGQCESVCPQHLHIVDSLKTVAKHFEEGNQ